MKLRIKLIDTNLPTPKYHTQGSVAFDLYSRVNTTIKPFEQKIIPLNVIIQVPHGHLLMLSARSSLPKKGLIVANGIGIIDEDYCGEKDEIGLFLINLSKKVVKIKKGERLAQATLIKISKAKVFEKVTKMENKSRGGFGSTG